MYSILHIIVRNQFMTSPCITSLVWIYVRWE